MNYNQDAWRLVEAKVKAEISAAVSAATQGAIKGKADDLPTSADFVGQLFVKTGATNPGLYVSTGTTTPGWKAVTHAE